MVARHLTIAVPLIPPPPAFSELPSYAGGSRHATLFKLNLLYLNCMLTQVDKELHLTFYVHLAYLKLVFKINRMYSSRKIAFKLI